MISDTQADIFSQHPEPAEGASHTVDGEPQFPNRHENADYENLCESDESAHDGREPSAIPYRRFKEVIGERNRLRDQIERLQRMQDQQPARETPGADMYSDDELNMLFRDNPAEAARTLFSQFLSHIQETNRIKDESLGQAIQRYPELADPSSEVALMARSILTAELSGLHDIPQGPAIAAEIAAARYYKDQYQQLARRHGINLQSLEATRTANLRTAHMEHSGHTAGRSCGEALSPEEQRVAQLMGVPVAQYAAHKQHTNEQRRS